MNCTAAHTHPHSDEVLVMCEDCGQDILQSEAHWRTCSEEYNGEGCVPLCSQCDAENDYRDQNPND
jgi:hypothetical protein